jgi:hypothetical protein
MGWTVWGSNPGVSVNARILPDRPWGPPSLLYIGYRVILGVKRTKVDHPPPCSVEVQESVELYLYSSLCAFVSCSRVKVPFTFTFMVGNYMCAGGGGGGGGLKSCFAGVVLWVSQTGRLLFNRKSVQTPVSTRFVILRIGSTFDTKGRILALRNSAKY